VVSHNMAPSTPPANWKSSAPLLPGPSFAAQRSQLPKLPVPELQHFLEELKRSLKPLAWSDREYKAALVKIDRLANGIGPKLQQRLLQRHAQTDNWLEEWLDRDEYLANRRSTVANLSYYSELIMTIPGLPFLTSNQSDSKIILLICPSPLSHALQPSPELLCFSVGNLSLEISDLMSRRKVRYAWILGGAC
jgi:hypothetical protein